MLKRLGLKWCVVNFLVFSNAWALPRYGETLCADAAYRCVTIGHDDSWAQLFTNATQRDLVKRVNRMNVFLKPGMVIAVPKQLSSITLLDVAPFAHHIPSLGEKTVEIHPDILAWAAYDDLGRLVKWGPVSTGAPKCPDVVGGCATPVGVFRVIRKQGEDCVSSVFPQRLEGASGGASMPYCIHFYKGYALHGSDELLGRATSHGCVNLFKDDAQWLNEQFVETPRKGHKGTLIVIRSSG